MFLNDNFMLNNQYAKDLFAQVKELPIIDYHCHLEAKEIFENQTFANLTQLWLNHDHYKWRLMRSAGIDESLITGKEKDFERFQAFCKTLPNAVGNPIFEWSHLELKRYFDIDLLINEANASAIYEQANAKLSTMKVQDFITQSKVQLICTTDDPIDDLDYHLKLQDKPFKVLPTFRPDLSFNIVDENYNSYINKLEAASSVTISSFEDLVQALKNRVEFFLSVGGQLADHGLNSFYYGSNFDNKHLNDIFIKALNNKELTFDEIADFQTALMLQLMEIYTQVKWTVQLHMNCHRNNSAKNLQAIGINSGFDSVGTQANIVHNIMKLYSHSQMQGFVPQTVFYSLNPNDNLALITMMQSFQGDYKQKMQLGSGWWFNDTASGMKSQLNTFAEQSLLGNFVGMLTDSRSFVSYSRFEYFRRILCNFLGELIEQGRVPADIEFVGQTAQNIAYYNAQQMFLPK